MFSQEQRVFLSFSFFKPTYSTVKYEEGLPHLSLRFFVICFRSFPCHCLICLIQEELKSTILCLNLLIKITDNVADFMN